MDVHKDSISIGVLAPEDDVAEVETIFHDEASVRRFFARFVDARRLVACYEAGPTGYELHRLLRSMGVACDVIAPSLIPRSAADRVKTDRRDAKKLARLHRAGQLVAIRVPSRQEEAIRDLCRARADMVDDLDRGRKRLGAFLLRHGVVWRGGSAWTMKHHDWLRARRFDDSALTATFCHYLGVVEGRERDLKAAEADLAPWYGREPFADPVSRLSAYRGVAQLGALTLAAETCDWRRFGRPSAFMGFTGLVPSEYSSGGKTSRGRITKAGNWHLRTQLIESAWAYQAGPSVGVELRRRQADLPEETVKRAWAAQVRLCGRFRRLSARKNSKNVVAAAVARELCGFLWAEMTA
jgi:transposase